METTEKPFYRGSAKNVIPRKGVGTLSKIDKASKFYRMELCCWNYAEEPTLMG
jgi:hypothetical protein